MEYKWDIESIKRHQKYYKELLRASRLSKEESISIKQMIFYLSEMEGIIKNGYYNNDRESLVKYVDRKKFLPVDTLDDFYEIHPKIQTIMIECAMVLANTVDTYQNIELPEVNRKEDQLVEMARDFAKWVPDKKYKKAFESYIDEKKHLLQFTTATNHEDKGVTYPFYYPHYRPYFLIHSSHTIEDFLTVNHEIAHGVFYQTDYHTTPNSNHYYLLELEGSFFDFLSIEYLKEKEEAAIIKELTYRSIISAYNNFLDFYLIDSAVRQYENSNRVSIEEITKQLVQDNIKMNVNKGILSTALQEDPMITAKYNLSYLASLDLEKIYEEDREYAFYLLKSIRKNKTENIFENLRENKITFLDDGYKNWKTKIKTLNTR